MKIKPRGNIKRRILLALRVQEFLRKKVMLRALKDGVEVVGGVDAAFKGRKIVATVSLFSFPALLPLEDKSHVGELSFPYIPGFLSFREGPAILMAYKKLSFKPQLLLFDGQGIAHPMGLGIASHLGVLLKIPTIGCAKSRLLGEYQEPGPLRGQWSYLYRGKEKIGAVLRSVDHVKPIFVSPGHLTDIESSVAFVLSCTTRFRTPEPIRRADVISKGIAKGL